MMTTNWRDRIEPEDENEARICADCGQTFILTKAARDWFTAKRLLLPRRCEDCRARRRQQREAS